MFNITKEPKQIFCGNDLQDVEENVLSLNDK